MGCDVRYSTSLSFILENGITWKLPVCILLNFSFEVDVTAAVLPKQDSGEIGVGAAGRLPGSIPGGRSYTM